MLAGVYGPQMPYRDPHTAGPALWALRDWEGCDFEVSVTVVEGTKVQRKALEAVAITLYRLGGGPLPDGQLRADAGRLPGFHRQQGSAGRHGAPRSGQAGPHCPLHHPQRPGGRLAGRQPGLRRLDGLALAWLGPGRSKRASQRTA